MNGLPLFTASIFIFDFEKDESLYKGYTIQAFSQHEAGEKAIALLQKEYENKTYTLNHMTVNLVKDNKIKIANTGIEEIAEDAPEEVSEEIGA